MERLVFLSRPEKSNTLAKLQTRMFPVPWSVTCRPTQDIHSMWTLSIFSTSAVMKTNAN